MSTKSGKGECDAVFLYNVTDITFLHICHIGFEFFFRLKKYELNYRGIVLSKLISRNTEWEKTDDFYLKLNCNVGEHRTLMIRA